MTSRLMETIHKTAKDFEEIGIIDTETMREFDKLCLPAVKTDNITTHIPTRDKFDKKQ